MSRRNKGTIRLQKNPSQYKWDIQNLDRIRFYFAGLNDEKEELMERFFEEEYSQSGRDFPPKV